MLSQCFYLPGRDIISHHYLLEDINSVPHRHKLSINLADGGVDSETEFTWCGFKRKIEPRDPYDLDLRRHYYQIYLWGDWNVSNSRCILSFCIFAQFTLQNIIWYYNGNNFIQLNFIFYRPMISQKSRILTSYMRLNASEPYSEIVFTGGHSLGSHRLSHDGFLFIATTFLLLTFVYF